MRSPWPASAASTTKRRNAASCVEARNVGLATMRSSAARTSAALGSPDRVEPDGILEAPALAHERPDACDLNRSPTPPRPSLGVIDPTNEGRHAPRGSFPSLESFCNVV